MMFFKLFLLFVFYCSHSAIINQATCSVILFNKFQNISLNLKNDIAKNRAASVEVRRHKREIRPVEFEKEDGSKIVLRLTPIYENVISFNIPVWTVETSRDGPYGHRYRKIDPRETLINGTFYEDPEAMATMFAYYNDNKIYYDGVFGEQKSAKFVKSFQEKWIYDFETKERKTNRSFQSQSNKSQDLERMAEEPSKGTMNEPSKILYIKLLVVIEYNHFKALGENIPETVKYVAIFWNAVNLKFSKLTNPKVIISITGLLISKDDNALGYIVNARSSKNNNQIDPDLLNDLGGIYFANYFKKEIKFYDYDSIFTMSNLDTGYIGGAAFKGRICSTDRNIGFVHDDNNYSGLKSATHELGHLLDLPHDGYQEASTCKDCLADEVCTIMSPWSNWVDKVVWSECSKELLNKFSKTPEAECLKDPIHSK